MSEKDTRKPIKDTKKGLYIGIIEQDEKGNFFCGPYLLDYKMVVAGFKLGDKISVKRVVTNPSDISFDKYNKKSVKFSMAGEDHGDNKFD